MVGLPCSSAIVALPSYDSRADNIRLDYVLVYLRMGNSEKEINFYLSFFIILCSVRALHFLQYFWIGKVLSPEVCFFKVSLFLLYSVTYPNALHLLHCKPVA